MGRANIAEEFWNSKEIETCQNRKPLDSHLFEFRTCMSAILGGEFQPLHLCQIAIQNRQQCISKHSMLESQGIWQFQRFYVIHPTYFS